MASSSTSKIWEYLGNVEKDKLSEELRSLADTERELTSLEASVVKMQEMKNEYANPEYQEVIKSLKAELKKQREDLNETDRDYPHLQKIIETHWNDS